ncbi:unnamed protein product, partial [Boreogadus saida]
ACRGREYDPPVTGMAGDSDEEDQVVADAGVFHTLPAGADFLMCYCVAKEECHEGRDVSDDETN